jgi:hypothetical protein
LGLNIAGRRLGLQEDAPLLRQAMDKGRFRHRSRSPKQNLELIYLPQNILAQQFHALDVFLCLDIF